MIDGVMSCVPQLTEENVYGKGNLPPEATTIEYWKDQVSKGVSGKAAAWPLFGNSREDVFKRLSSFSQSNESDLVSNTLLIGSNKVIYKIMFCVSA